MTHVEFLRWHEFYRLHPFDDRHRYYRPAALLASLKPNHEYALQDVLDWLEPDPKVAGLSSADMNTLKAFGLRK